MLHNVLDFHKFCEISCKALNTRCFTCKGTNVLFSIRFIKQNAVGFLLLFSLSCLHSVAGPVSVVTNLTDPPEKSDR